jgi:hypothetical protein
MAQEWDIKPRAAGCAGCENEFGDGQVCHSALLLGTDGYRRADFCEDCWKGSGNRLSPFSTWQGRFVKPLPPPEEPLKKENAESLLRRLMEDEEASRNVIYILAVMLERKKVLIEKDVKPNEDGTSLRIYEHRKTGETFLIPDPHLLLDQLETVQREVVGMLGGSSRPSGTEGQVAGRQLESEPPDGPEHHV